MVIVIPIQVVAVFLFHSQSEAQIKKRNAERGTITLEIACMLLIQLLSQIKFWTVVTVFSGEFLVVATHLLFMGDINDIKATVSSSEVVPQIFQHG